MHTFVLCNARHDDASTCRSHNGFLSTHISTYDSRRKDPSVVSKDRSVVCLRQKVLSYIRIYACPTLQC